MGWPLLLTVWCYMARLTLPSRVGGTHPSACLNATSALSTQQGTRQSSAVQPASTGSCPTFQPRRMLARMPGCVGSSPAAAGLGNPVLKPEGSVGASTRSRSTSCRVASGGSSGACKPLSSHHSADASCSVHTNHIHEQQQRDTRAILELWPGAPVHAQTASFLPVPAALCMQWLACRAAMDVPGGSVGAQSCRSLCSIRAWRSTAANDRVRCIKSGWHKTLWHGGTLSTGYCRAHAHMPSSLSHEMVLTHALGLACGGSAVHKILQHACKGRVSVCPPVGLQGLMGYLKRHSLWLLALQTGS